MKISLVSQIKYAAKMLTMPLDTVYELKGRRVNRFTHTIGTLVLLHRVDKKPRFHTRYRLEIARERFFSEWRIGRAILYAAARLHEKYPDNKVFEKAWNACLPF